MIRQQALLTVKQLKHEVFGPVDLCLYKNQLVTLAGRSGIGKSLFLRCLADLEPHQGSIYLADVEQQQIAPTLWRRSVALLPAESKWWYSQVGEHFHQLDMSLFNQFGFDEQVLSWSVNRLSSGEKQRLALLRLLQNRPKVLLLDEPTANVDPEMTSKVELLIQNYLQQQAAAVIWVTHDPTQAQRIADVQYEFTREAIILAKIDH